MRAGLILIFIGFTTIVFTQDYFNERFGFFYPNVVDGALNALEVDSGYILNGATGDSINPYWLRLGMIKFNLSGEIQWKKTWGDKISIWYYASKGTLIKRLGYYFTIGSKKTWYEWGGHSETMLTKYDSNFDTVWTAVYGKKQYPYDSSYIARSFTGIEKGFAVVGTLEIYTEKNENNNDLKEIDIDKNMINPLKLNRESYKHEIYLLKMDSLGNVIWEHNYPDSILRGQGMSVIQTTDGGYAIGAYRWTIGPYGVSIGDPIVIKTDSLGNQEWELNLGSQYQDGSAILCKLEDGDFIAVSRYDIDSLGIDKYHSRIQLTKIDNEGNIVWSKLYCDKAHWTGPTNIRTDSSGGYIISGAIGDNNWPIEPSKMGFMLRVNSAGDSLWYRKYAVLYDKNSQNYLYDVIPTSDGGFLGAGGCLPVGSDTGTQDAWVIKVDSLGCTSPTDCWVGEQELESPDNNDHIAIYPNPTKNKFKVQSLMFEVGGCNIEIFDLFGRKLEEIQVPKGQTVIKVNAIGWQKGLYVVKVINKQGKISGTKVVIR